MGGTALAAVAISPGRGKPRSLSWQDELAVQTSTAGLPLFDWAMETGRPAAPGAAGITSPIRQLTIPCPDAEPPCNGNLLTQMDGTGQEVTDDNAKALAVRNDSPPLVQRCAGVASEYA
jgi:hypothetical protein